MLAALPALALARYRVLATAKLVQVVGPGLQHLAPLFDELGPVVGPAQAMEQRYGRVSTVITTNLDYPSWYEMFGNKPLVDALLDRLRHQCITIRIDGPSLREPMPCPETDTPPVKGATPPSSDQRAKKASRKPA